MVKWKKKFSSCVTVKGGGPQGGTAGFIEYISQSSNNFNFLNSDEVYKYIDDASSIEIISLLTIGLSTFNCKQSVPSDMSTSDHFIQANNLKSQEQLNKINQWTQQNKMKVNNEKCKYMIFNFCNNSQFQTRLHMEDTLLEQVKVHKLLGIYISDDLSWKVNTTHLVKRAYARMSILRKLYEFKIDITDLIKIYYTHYI